MPKTTYTLRLQAEFDDIITGERHRPGEILVTDDGARAKNIVALNFGRLIAINSGEKKGKKVVFYLSEIAKIGGIETAMYHLARVFCDRNITFRARTADTSQMLRLGRYANVELDDNTEFECDVLVAVSWNALAMCKGRVRARRVYQQVHADWETLRKFPLWQNYDWAPDATIDKVLAVSETAQKSLQTAFSRPINSVLVPNLFVEPDDEPVVTLCSMTRLTDEKGAARIVKMVDAFHAANKQFLWFISATLANSGIGDKLRNDTSVVFLSPRIDNVPLLGSVDYCVQLSDSESYCYTIREALSYGTRCICTRIPELEKVVDSSERGFLVKKDLSDLDADKIQKIFSIPRKPSLYHDKEAKKIKALWEKVLNGEI